MKPVLKTLEIILGTSEILENLKRLFAMIEPIAKRHGIELQLDPTFQPHFELYTGIIFQLICKGNSAPVVIASGGRYDELVKHFGAKGDNATGLGFSFAIDKIIIAYSKKNILAEALKRQRYWHKQHKVASVELEPFENKEAALVVSKQRGCTKLEWIDDLEWLNILNTLGLLIITKAIINKLL